jgi:DNA transformation protein and related proteins
MGKLSELPNIGKELEDRLEKVGIRTVQQLRDAGSIRAFQQIHACDPTSCINMLYALEGAIQNIRWHLLDPGIKQELKYFFVKLKTGDCDKE